jgi:hypothetical protein
MTGNIIMSPPRVNPKALLIIYFHDPLQTIPTLSQPTTCADNTCAIISIKHFDHYCHKSVSNEKWFAVKKVDLSSYDTYLYQLILLSMHQILM